MKFQKIKNLNSVFFINYLMEFQIIFCINFISNNKEFKWSFESKLFE